MSQLVPDPTAVANLVVRMTRLPWPSGAADRDRYFAELGLVDGGLPERRGTIPIPSGRCSRPPLSGVVDASVSLFRCELLGIHITCFNQRQDNGPPRRRKASQQ
jgi:hypothetical protein